MPMPVPATAAPTPRACDMYQQDFSCGVRTYAIIMGWVQLVAFINLTNASAVVLWFSSEKLLHADVFFVLLTLNGLMLTIGIYFGIIFVRGAHCGEIYDLKSYKKFAIFSIIFHLIAFLAFAVLEVWMFVGLSVIPVAVCGAGLRFVAAVNKKIIEINKMIEDRLILQCVRNMQQQLPGPPPPYSSCLVQVQQRNQPEQPPPPYSSYFVQQP